MLVMVAWFGYKWWNSRCVVALLPALTARGATLVDVRSAGEYASADAPGTVNIPLGDLGKRLAEIPRAAPVVEAFASCTRSGMAKLILQNNRLHRGAQYRCLEKIVVTQRPTDVKGGLVNAWR